MAGKKMVLTVDTEKILKKMGMQIKKARLRRNICAERLAECVGISKGTLSSIEKGVSTVSIGAYAAVLCELGLEKDLELVALDTEGKKQLWEKNLKPRIRATRKKEYNKFISREGEL